MTYGLENQMMHAAGLNLMQPGRDGADQTHGLKIGPAAGEVTGHAEKIVFAVLLALISLSSVTPAEARATVAKGSGNPDAKTCAIIRAEVARGNLLPAWLDLCVGKKKPTPK